MLSYEIQKVIKFIYNGEYRWQHQDLNGRFISEGYWTHIDNYNHLTDKSKIEEIYYKVISKKFKRSLSFSTLEQAQKKAKEIFD